MAKEKKFITCGSRELHVLGGSCYLPHHPELTYG